jgi:hypothetical protein
LPVVGVIFEDFFVHVIIYGTAGCSNDLDKVLSGQYLVTRSDRFNTHL